MIRKGESQRFWTTYYAVEQVWQANKDASPFLCCSIVLIVVVVVVMVIMVVVVIVVTVFGCTMHMNHNQSLLFIFD